MSQVDGFDNFERLFEHLPGVLFFVKDKPGQMLTCNSEMFKMYNTGDVSGVTGKSGINFFPQEIARNFVADDRRVIEHGEEIINRIELNLDGEGRLAWYQTSKLPLFNKKRKIIGLMGISRQLDAADKELNVFDRMKPAVNYIHENLRGEVSVKKLAELSCLSVNQFHRSFKKSFAITPNQFIQKLRVQKACSLLQHSILNISEVGYECGFSDQNYFSRCFVKIIGLTPSAYRHKYR